MNNLEKVKQFNLAGGQHIPSDITIDLHTIKNILTLLREEIDELEDAMKDNNSVEVLDAFVDIDYILKGGILKCGLEKYFQKAFDLVHENNMTKIMYSESNAIETVKFYKSKGVEAEYKENEYGFYCYRVLDNKILKPFNFKSVDLKQVIFN